MNKILVKIKKDYLCFSKYEKDIKLENLNNTNVINAKNLKFTEEYINNNRELIATFFNLIILKFNISKVMIEDIDIGEVVLLVIKLLPSIKEVYFSDDRELNYTISSLLLENINLEKIDCYSMPEIMYYRFSDNIVDIRCETLFLSDFMKYNGIDTYSKLCSRNKIFINKKLNNYDIDDLRYFLKKNKHLRRIVLNVYIVENLLNILNLLKESNYKKVTIIICEDSNTTDRILKDINFFDKLNLKYNVNIKIKYSNSYYKNNLFKEMNIIFLRQVFLVCIVISIVMFGFFRYDINKDSNLIKKNINVIDKEINEVVLEDEVVEIDTNDIYSYISPYYRNYERVYNKLLEINSDTVGWLKVNNTKIDYPIVQTSDNSYYLNKAFDGTNNKMGWLFVDYRNNMNNLDKNTIIYGHTMTTGGDLMFTTLNNVLDSNWYLNEENLNINFNVKGVDMVYRIFSIYTIEETSDYLYTNFNSSLEYLNFINMIKSRSIVDFGIEINENDSILTLSTCYKSDEYRIVVHAKKV